MSEEEDTQKVWEKGTVVPHYDKDKYRKDACGAWMTREMHGNRDSVFGWEKHHPNGTDDPEKRIPLQWKNNLETGDGSLKCPVTAQDKTNVESDNG